MNELRVSIAIQSHLSDASYEMRTDNAELIDLAERRIHFVKHLISQFPNTDIFVDTDELDEMWKALWPSSIE